MERPQYTNKPFHEALGELLAERYADKLVHSPYNIGRTERKEK